MAYKPEVEVNGTWCRNALVFATREEAEANAANLYSRHRAVEVNEPVITGHRAVEVDEPVNYRWIDGRLEPVA